jgi:hypothetical protein
MLEPQLQKIILQQNKYPLFMAEVRKHNNLKNVIEHVYIPSSITTASARLLTEHVCLFRVKIYDVYRFAW